MRLAIQYLSDEKGQKSAVQLPLQEWEKLLARMRKYEQMLQLKQGLEQSFAEVKKMQKGLVPKQSLSDFLDEL